LRTKPWEFTADEAGEESERLCTKRSSKARKAAFWIGVERREYGIIIALQQGAKIPEAVLDEGLNWHRGTFRDYMTQSNRP
jgi:hypothetical protein